MRGHLLLVDSKKLGFDLVVELKKNGSYEMDYTCEKSIENFEDFDLIYAA